MLAFFLFTSANVRKIDMQLTFNNDTRRWQIGERELHCGDCFKLHDDEGKLPAINVRIEYGRDDWYLITPYGITKPSERKAE